MQSRHLHLRPVFAGHYAFIESSAPRRSGDRAWLQSPTLQASTPVCLSFWYNMYGADTGFLNVLVWPTTGSPNTSTLVWSQQGDQGRDWNLGRVSVYNSLPFHVSVWVFFWGGGGDYFVQFLSYSTT